MADGENQVRLDRLDALPLADDEELLLWRVPSSLDALTFNTLSSRLSRDH